MLTFAEARASVLLHVQSTFAFAEKVPLDDALHRVLATPAHADRDFPPFRRSARDGFAVRASEVPAEFRLIGEVQAGQCFTGQVGPGEAVEIMTGAPVPDGADSVVMVEHITRAEGRVRTTRPAGLGENISQRGEEALSGGLLIPAGRRLSYPDIAVLAATGQDEVSVYRKPRVAILPTGDELVPVPATPLTHQIRNSNAHSLAAQVARAGGIPWMITPARDNEVSTREAITLGLEADLLLLSGGVSAGKYDIVERILSEFGAEFYFDRVSIQPGQPVVFGRALSPAGTDRRKQVFFFGLPGNPNSTMVTFELFARAALERLSGQSEPALRFAFARLTRGFHHKPGLTRFLPAHLSEDGELTPISSKGSADIAALSRSNVFLVADSDRPEWQAGDMMRILFP